MSLLGIPVANSYPDIATGNPGSVTYDTGSTKFSLNTTDITFIESPSVTDTISPATGGGQASSLNIFVNHSGAVTGGAGVGDDLVVVGKFTTAANDTYDGVLLTGKILEFGSDLAPSPFPAFPGEGDFDFRVLPTGGLLKNVYFQNKDVGIAGTTLGDVPVNGFNSSFTLGEAKFNIVPIEPLSTGIHIVKLTNGTDNDTGTGPFVPVGSTVTWTYNVTNPGNTALSNVTVTDNIAGVNPTPVLSGGFNVGDSNNDGFLEAGETWVFTASGVAVAGQYSNVGTATGTPVDVNGNPVVNVPPPTDSNPDHYFAATTGIGLVKLTNGTDNDSPTGPFLPVGSTVTWTYLVTNTGNVPLNGVTVTDDHAPQVVPAPVLSGGFNVGDTNADGYLTPGEIWRYTATGIATAGQYTNLGTTTGTPWDIAHNQQIPGTSQVHATNPDNYFGAAPDISLVKWTNGTDNDTGTGPLLLVGSTVTWSYIVTNTGNVTLTSVVVTDDNGTPANTADDFTVGTVASLAPGATATLTHAGVAAAGQYGNVGSVVGTPVDGGGNPIPGATNPTDTNPDHYYAYLPVSVGDFVWNDLNGNGVQNAGEPGINGVSLTLGGTDVLGNPVSLTTTTAGNGGYLFSGLLPGTYTVTVSTPAGYVPTATGQGTAATDSNPTPTGTTPAALPSGGSDFTLDFGFYQPAAIGDYAWVDANANGQQDAGEAPLPGVTVTLNGTTGAGAPVTATATTDANGLYHFTGLAPGSYTVSFAGPSGYVLTAANVGSDASDSDATPAGASSGTTGSYTLISGQTNNTVDAGFYKPVSIGNFVWNDLNGNGVQDSGEPGIPGVTLTITGTSGSGASITQTTTTDANGLYQFTEPPGTYTVAVTAPSGYVATATGKGTTATDSNPSPSGTTPGTLASGGSDQTIDFGFYKLVSIGNFVWNDLNGNGVQDSGEPGINGVILNLTGTTGAGVAVNLTTTTAGNGAYLFGNLAPGTYAVAVTSVPGGYVPTLTGQGTTATDSNPSPSGTTPAALPGGSSDLTLDFGYYQPAAIGDYVWEDVNANGLQDANEPGIPGIQVNLLNSVGTVIGTMPTDGSGYYHFTGLAPGTYSIQFVVDPNDWVITTQNVGTNDAIDSDANTTTGKTGTYTLTSGQTNNTVDAGLVGVLHGRTGTIGFWANKNGQDMIQLLGASWSTYGTSKALGAWLANNFPNLYGKNAGLNNFSSATTSYIAARFIALKGTSPKTEAQVLAVALAIYTTTKSLNNTTDGQANAMKHGFLLSNAGDSSNLQNVLWNVEGNGEAFGVADNSSIKVIDLLKKVNSYAVNGVLYASGFVGSTYYGTTYLTNEVNVVFSAINQAGDILSWM